MSELIKNRYDFVCFLMLLTEINGDRMVIFKS